MAELRIRTYDPDDEGAVIDLWQSCGLVAPQNDPRRDIATKLAFQPELFLVGEIEGRVVATAMAGYEGHRGWIHYLATEPSLQRQGVGRRLLEAAEFALRDLGCPKVNLQVRVRVRDRDGNRDLVAFYERLGYAVEERVSLGKRLGPD